MAKKNTIHIIGFRPRRYGGQSVPETDSVRAGSTIVRASSTVYKASKND